MLNSDNGNDISPFIVGKYIQEPESFWARDYERREILGRLRTMQSTSIVGERRIGKTSLAFYIYKVGPTDLGGSYEFVWLDGQSSHLKSISNFCSAIASQSTLNYVLSQDISQCLINFEDAAIKHSKKLVLIINELETLVDDEHQAEFTQAFFNTLRFLAESSHIALVTTSYTSLKDVCKSVLGATSPFYNIFLELSLDVFSDEEVDLFLRSKHRNIVMEPFEIKFIKSKVKLYQHPLILQIACDSVYKNRQLQSSKERVLNRITQATKYFLGHQQVINQRNNMKNRQKTISKPLDLFLSIMIPVLGLGLIMLEYGLLIRFLTNFQSVLLALVTAIIGFAILVFAGRSIDIIGESTFYNLFLEIIKQIPLLSNIADKIIDFAGKVKDKEES